MNRGLGIIPLFMRAIQALEGEQIHHGATVLAVK